MLNRAERMIEDHQFRIVDADQCREILDLAFSDQCRGCCSADGNDWRFPDIKPDRLGEADRFVATDIDIPACGSSVVA